jgi:hypothetical protein
MKKKPFHSIAIAVFASGLLAVNALADAPDGWKAGVAKTVITPKTPVWMAGYAGRNGPSEGVLTDLHARALLLEDARDHRLVIVSMDLIEIPDTFRQAIIEMAKKKHNLKPEELLLNVSHTHGGPMLSSKTVADWGLEQIWGKRAEEYVAEVVNKLDSLIEKALSSKRPVIVGYSHARCGFAMNRRMPTPGGFRLGPNPEGPVDHDVPVLRIESPEKKLIAFVFGYACHNTSLGPTRMLNGDYAGFALRKLEKDHPDAVALFLAGCGGDQDPAPRRNQEDAEQNGASLAMAVEAALVPVPVALKPQISLRLELCPIAFAPLPLRADLATRAKSADGFVSRHAQWVLKQWPKPTDHPAEYQLPIQVVELGQKLTLVALGGEPVADYAIRLKKELVTHNHFVWVAGYSNLVNAYVPSRRVLLEGGYEGTEAVIYQSLPGPFHRDVEERIIESVHRLVNQVREKSPHK